MDGGLTFAAVLGWPRSCHVTQTRIDSIDPVCITVRGSAQFVNPVGVSAALICDAGLARRRRWCA